MLAITILSLVRLQVQRVRLLRLEVRLEAEGAHRGVEDDEARGERRPVRRIFVRKDVDDDVRHHRDRHGEVGVWAEVDEREVEAARELPPRPRDGEGVAQEVGASPNKSVLSVITGAFPVRKRATQNL